MTITIPTDWRPRPYQRKLWRFLVSGGRRAVAVWHRRAGKEIIALNFAAVAAHIRVGLYWHMLPTQAQGRKVVWDSIDARGRRVIDQVFPRALRSATNTTEMKITLRAGSVWQLVGSDNYNGLIGANPVGVVFSEYAVADPAAWDFIRPILAENGGWALFIFTPRGRTHGHALYAQAQANAEWFAERLTVEDTQAISAEAVAAERQAGMADEMVEQEFYCSFEAPLVGAYYGKAITTAEQDGRIANAPWEPNLAVNTAWDLGIGDATVIWFWQQTGREIRLIDYYEHSGVGLEHYAKMLKDKPYVYGEHLAPHDIEVSELGTGRTRREMLKSFGIKVRVVPKLTVDDGINAVRAVLPRCWFDAAKCARGLEALRQYRKAWDDKQRCYRDRPLHDWTSHAADAFRYLAVGQRDRLSGPRRQITALSDYDWATGRGGAR